MRNDILMERSPMSNSQRGMTLIELMIALVILAIVAAIAVPSYRSYVLRANRTEAMAALLQIQQAQEKYFLQNNTYAGAGQLTAAPPAGLGIPTTTPHGNYDVTVALSNGGSSFSATATSKGAQQKDADCTQFTIDESGKRGSTPKAITTCWK